MLNQHVIIFKTFVELFSIVAKTETYIGYKFEYREDVQIYNKTKLLSRLTKFRTSNYVATFTSFTFLHISSALEPPALME